MLAIDLFCGLGGWTDGLLAEGYDVIGFDIEEHAYGDMRYPGKLVLQDVLTLHGSQFKDAALIVASPPCQEYSYMAMPWKLAKAKAAAIRADTTGESLVALNRLFNACFRIQREAIEAAGHHIPMVVENVRGACKWVGCSRWNYGSFHLWGDVPALMPMTKKILKGGWLSQADGAAMRRDDGAKSDGFKTAGMNWSNRELHGQDFTRTAGKQAAEDGQKVPGFRFDGSGRRFQSASVAEHLKVPSEQGQRTDPGKGARFTSRDCGVEAAGQHAVDQDTGTKIGGDWFSDPKSTCRRHGSKSKGRKMASAMIAKIPLVLSRHIAAIYRA